MIIDVRVTSSGELEELIFQSQPNYLMPFVIKKITPYGELKEFFDDWHTANDAWERN